MEGGELSDLPPFPESITDLFEQCGRLGLNFSPGLFFAIAPAPQAHTISLAFQGARSPSAFETAASLAVALITLDASIDCAALRRRERGFAPDLSEVDRLEQPRRGWSSLKPRSPRSNDGDGVNRGNDVDPDKSYAVGNKKPPLHTRFKPGQSGNPRGRPNGCSNLGTTMAKELNKMVSATINGKAKKVTKGEAFVLALVTDGITKGPQSRALLLNLIRQQEREAAVHRKG